MSGSLSVPKGTHTGAWQMEALSQTEEPWGYILRGLGDRWTLDLGTVLLVWQSAMLVIRPGKEQRGSPVRTQDSLREVAL